MNKNKLIFFIIGLLILFSIVFIIININSNKVIGEKTSGKFSVWIVGDKVDSDSKIFEKFLGLYSKYKNVEITVESFDNFDDYSLALTSAIIKGKAPDIFVLNNNEKTSLFDEQTYLIDPASINPNDFRKRYKGVFADDLIYGSGTTEYLKGLPVGYETLGIFFNRRYVQNSDLSSIASLNNVIAEIKNSNSSIVPIGIGNGSTVYGVSDILSQFFMLDDGVAGLDSLDGKKFIQGISSYLSYGDQGGYNRYDSKYLELVNQNQTSLDLFSKGDTYMVVGYPRLIQQIQQKGFSKNFLLASAFPHYSDSEGKTLLNYNYFVINKDTKQYSLANDFLTYLSTDSGAQDYLSNFSYYLPALISLESDKLDQKISSDFNIILGDFYNGDYELSSFDKGIKTIFDEGIIGVLDNAGSYDISFPKLRNTILCKSKKIMSLDNLSTSCE